MKRWIDETFNPHFRCGMEAESVLYEGHTGLQDLIIFDNKTFGRVMILDGIFQLSEKDEFIYHEMMVHVPLLSQTNPEKVLVIGGGDGGVVREILKHPSIKSVVHCEIDGVVVEMSRKFLPEVSRGAFEDPRMELIIGDGIKFVKETDQQFDAIIVDSTEPVGPAKVLFTEDFFAACQKRLMPDGVFISQNGLPFLYPEHLTESAGTLRKLYADAACYMCCQPTYFGGPFALAWGANRANAWNVPLETLQSRFNERELTTRYYNPETHLAAFALPGYVAEAWNKGNQSGGA